jgi:hypothetical protein
MERVLMSNFDILVDDKDDDSPDRINDIDSSLVSWVMTRVKDWEDHRDQNYRTKWNEYYRLWRGFWDSKDKNRDSERSKIISPALSQAIEATVSELEEASFGQGKWFDVSDDAVDEDPTDLAMFRDQLNEDLDKADVPSNIAEVFLNGAIYGTGIGKIVVEEITTKEINASPLRETEITTMSVSDKPTVQVGLIAVHPQEFVIDPAARTINDGLGCAHITTVPKHSIEKKQQDGTYKDVTISGYTDTIVGDRNIDNTKELRDIRNADKTMLIEYHGLVPRSLLSVDIEEDESVVSLFEGEEAEIDETDLVEAVVTIANGTTLLRGIESPFALKDRSFIAYQHDKVPNRFWGRGIAEKGYNPQKALDAELRGRIDAMALSIHPMMGIDATRIPRGGNFKIAPGRNVFTNGDPNTILRPFTFGQVNNNTFAQTGELERMVQMGTGAMDSATPLAENRRNETSSGMSMIMGGAIKRSKRTLANIERTFMKPLIHKAAWRYMQFAPDRYATVDIKFNVHSTLGMVARELEQQQLANMMNTVPPDSPAFWMLLKAIYEHSSISNREEMLEVIEQMMQSSLQKQQQPEQQDPMVALKQQELQLKSQMDQAKLQLDQQENSQDAQLELAKLQLEYEKLRLKERELIMDAKVELAKMEQDSAVTVAQMSQKAFESKKPTEPKAEKPAVINIHQGSGKKSVTVTRTESGLEGSIEESNA